MFMDLFKDAKVDNEINSLVSIQVDVSTFFVGMRPYLQSIPDIEVIERGFQAFPVDPMYGNLDIKIAFIDQVNGEGSFFAEFALGGHGRLRTQKKPPAESQGRNAKPGVTEPCPEQVNCKLLADLHGTCR
jgi:hypothetical protein